MTLNHAVIGWDGEESEVGGGWNVEWGFTGGCAGRGRMYTSDVGTRVDNYLIQLR